MGMALVATLARARDQLAIETKVEHDQIRQQRDRLFQPFDGGWLR